MRRARPTPPMLSRACLAAVLPAVLAVALLTPPARAEERALVELPAMMQEHMLANMRDHLRAIEEILAALAADDADTAAQIAETRLGMSSLGSHGAAHMAQFMPETMRSLGTDMHRAASRFALAVQDADLDPSPQAAQGVHGALQEILGSCNACHASYRLR
ncbi:MAG: cytochrome c [Neomegalonema sp.]|nr:cytochrome c [Neomegalonema sp.]